MEDYITDFCPYPSAVPPLALYEKYLSNMTTDKGLNELKIVNTV